MRGMSASELPGVLAAPYAGHQSGFLHFKRDGERRSLRFRQGHIVYASTNVVEHRLGETLVRQGRLSHDNLRLALDVVEQQGALLGPVLLALGYLKEHQLPEALEMHARTVIEPLFAWTRGAYEFEPDQGSATVAHRPAEKFTADLIAAAARQLTDQAAILSALGNLHRPLAPGDLPPGADSFSLLEQEDAALRLVDGVRTAQEIVALCPEAPWKTQRCILTLLSTGLVEWLPTRPAEPAAARPPALYEIRDALDRAKTWVAIGKYWEAIQILEHLVPRLDDPTTRRGAQVLLAVAYLKNPNWARRAEGVLQAVIAGDPQNTDALYLLGNLYREKGLDRRAESMLRRVLDIKPNHRGAMATLKALRQKH
jgi:tetratricopeptide (TPR) repeat protein